MHTNPVTIADNKTFADIPSDACTRVKETGSFILQPVGPLDTRTHALLKEEVDSILASNPEAIVFDLKHVNYINGRGLRVILKTFQKMKQRHRPVYLWNLQPRIKEIFEIVSDKFPDKRDGI